MLSLPVCLGPAARLGSAAGAEPRFRHTVSKGTQTMKKIATFAFAGAAAFALAACGSSDSASEEAVAENVEMPAEEAVAPLDPAATPAAVDAAASDAASPAASDAAAAQDASAAAEEATKDAEKKM